MKKLAILLMLLPASLWAQILHVDNPQAMTWVEGAIERGDRTEKKISLVFTSDGFIDGYQTIRATLKKYGIKGAFFFTGNFYRMPECAPIVKGLKKDGHYLGPHSDRHLLWCAWEDRDTVCWWTRSPCTRTSWTTTEKWPASALNSRKPR